MDHVRRWEGRLPERLQGPPHAGLRLDRSRARPRDRPRAPSAATGIQPVSCGNKAYVANWGLEAGGGYYLHVATQFSNKLAVIDVDPNGDGSAADAVVAGRVLLANGVPGGPRTTDGTGGQGIKPLPNVYDGWVQDTVARAAQTDPEVQGWIAQMTPCQKNPAGPTCAAGPGR